MDRTEILKEFYNSISEDARLEQSRQGQLEYFVTMHYIHKFLKPGDRVLEIGAGTGRYSVALAKEGYRVTSVELVESNLSALREKARGLCNIEAYQGDALDLGRFEDGIRDVTLSLGPMYHLYEAQDQHKALDEAIRVTKPGGILFAAFLSAHAIICTNYLYDWAPTIRGLKENFDGDYKVKHFKEQLFTGFDIAEFEALFADKEVAHLSTVAVDNVLEIAENRADFSMTDEGFAAFADYQLHICEKREMLGNSSHLLYICQKSARPARQAAGESCDTIKKADINDAGALAALAIRMWPDHDPGELAEEFRKILANGEAACFLGYADGRPVAFAQCQLRHDYVEGTHSSPVGYLEGIFVAEGYRRKGCAARLLAACEAWAKEKGCTEFASDCELDNAESIQFHAAMGFTETNRIVCFKKEL